MGRFIYVHTLQSVTDPSRGVSEVKDKPPGICKAR